MKENIELVMIFQGANSGPLDHIRYFSQLAEDLFGSGFEEISYSVLLKGKKYNKLKSKTMKFSAKAIESFESDVMAGAKFPDMFIAGIGNDNLTDKEEELLKTWNEGKDQCDRNIWTVLWGNLVTSRHFKRPENLDKLRKVRRECPRVGWVGFVLPPALG